jgi:hypothetical protein
VTAGFRMFFPRLHRGAVKDQLTHMEGILPEEKAILDKVIMPLLTATLRWCVQLMRKDKVCSGGYQGSGISAL